MTRPGRSMLARLYGQFDRKVSAPASYAGGYLRTQLSGGRFGRFPSIEGPVELRIRGVAVVGKHFKGRAVTWRSRIAVGPDGILRIGDDFRMNDGVSIQVWHEVTIGSNVMMAPFSSIIDDHCHWIEPDSVTYERPVVIGDNVWLGNNAIVLPGVTIGSGSVIAANSVVSRDIPPNSLAAGAPAKVVRTLDVPPGWTHCYGYDGYAPGAGLVSSLKRAVPAQ
jgi:acetyltransferase-like isoleucine patch superfamily enzyme